MANIELVIKIPEVYFEALKKTDEIVSGQRSGKTLMSVIYGAVAKGIPIPKGHGRLIDADAISLDDIGFFSISDHQKMVHKLTTSCQTIIEADKEE